MCPMTDSLILSSSPSVNEKPLSPHFHDYDPDVAGRLAEEIRTAHDSGLSCAVFGVDEDLAYRNVKDLAAVNEALDAKQVRYAKIAEPIGRGFLGIVESIPLSPFRRRLRRRRKGLLDEQRKEILYSSIAAVPWLQQCGRAAALATITAAFDLLLEQGPHSATCSAGQDQELVVEPSPEYYDGMGGPLQQANLDSPFVAAGNIKGRTVRDLLVSMEGRRFSDEEKQQRAEKRYRETQEFLHSPITEGFREIVQYCWDGVGIRERKNLVNQLIHEHLSVIQRTRNIDDLLLMSVGCGTALPVMEAMTQIKQTFGAAPTLILLDQDPIALKLAEELARRYGLLDRIEIQCRQLFDGRGRLTRLEDFLQGRRLDVIEDSGLREYLPDSVYVNLTTSAYRALREGGLMVSSNMNVNRPQKEFLHGLMGWPIPVLHRTIEQGINLHARAQIDTATINIHVVPSGVYTAFSLIKP